MWKNKGLPEGSVEDAYVKISLHISKRQRKWIDEVRDRIEDSKGHRLGRTEVIRAAIDFVATLKPNLKGVKGEKELLERIRAAAKK